MELVSLVFAEPFKTSFLINPTGIKLSSFQGSLPNVGTTYRITFCSACITLINVMFVVFIVIFLQVQLVLIDFLKQRSWHTLLLGAERSSSWITGGLIISSK